MKDKYSISVFWSEEDNCFIATSPEFPLLSAHGETKEEAAGEMQVVLDMAIESYEEDNLELPHPKTSVSHSGQFRIRIPKSTHKGLAEEAEREGVSLNTYVLSLLTESHTFKKAYTEEIEVLRNLVERLSHSLIYQHKELQVHTQKINLLKKSGIMPNIEQDKQASFETVAPIIYTKMLHN